MANMNRIMVSIPPDIEAEIEALRRGAFKGRSQAEFLRLLLRRGLQTVAEAKKAGEKQG